MGMVCDSTGSAITLRNSQIKLCKVSKEATSLSPHKRLLRNLKLKVLGVLTLEM